MKNKLFIVGGAILAIALGVGSLYAINTLIVNIPGGQTSTNLNSVGTQTMTANDGDLRYMNKDNDANTPGDFFVGYYFDPAYGFFKTNASINPNNNVRISGISVASCGVNYDGYKLTGHAYNSDFGFIDFNYDINTYVYICIPQDSNDSSLKSLLHGYAYSPYIGFQNFDDIFLDTSVDIGGDNGSSGRFLKVEGLSSAQNSQESIANQFPDDIRVLGKITKAALKRDIQQKVYSSIRNVTPENGIAPYSVSGLGSSTWSSGDGRILQNGSILYFGDMGSANVLISGSNAITGNKTLVVEGGNIYISGDIRGSGMLGLIALEKNGQGGNIYINPSVTDIHAIMYADKSVVSYDGVSELDGNTPASQLANQLYIYGSIFSENTIGGSISTLCPYYVANASCNDIVSKKYDLNLLRRYILVQVVDADGNAIGDPVPQFGGAESYMGDNDRTNTEIQKPGYRVYPMVIEYNPKVQQTPPPFFD